VLTLRVDESLYFANARFWRTSCRTAWTEDGPVKHVVLMCSAVNEIDMSRAGKPRGDQRAAAQHGRR
jgi:SulP family sulfate permease